MGEKDGGGLEQANLQARGACREEETSRIQSSPAPKTT